jgi:indolepyruvate ferredoxin oxidoreductase beta subunit
MENTNIVLGGLGGQGILFMTKILAEAALRKGINVMGAETHGMAQRGGSVISHLRLGDVNSSLVRSRSAHLLLALEENEAYRNIPFLAKGGRMYANASHHTFPRQEIIPSLEKMEIICRAISASEVAMKLNAPMSSNLALLGFFSAFDEGPISQTELRETIDEISPDRFKEMNLQVFDAGLQSGQKERR